MVLYYSVLGFGVVAMTFLSLIAWYNSDKPAGWDFVTTPKWANWDWAKAKGEQGEAPSSDFANISPTDTAPRI